MSSELQPALHLTLPSGEFDSHMLVIFVVMLFAGILGGAANFFLSERERKTERRDWIKYPVFGVVAALTVPLFLNMISSTLLEGARTRPIDFFVFAGFCLIYVVASRNLFENLVQRLTGQIARVSSDISHIRESQSQALIEAAKQAEVSVPPPPPVAKKEPEPARPAEPDPQKVITYQDVEILRTLSEGSYVCGNLAAICERSGLQREFVSQRLAALKLQGIIDTRISDKNVLHWCLSSNGKAVLDEIMSGENRKIS